MLKELIGHQNISETLEVSAYTVRNWIGSIVPGSVEPLLECALFIDRRELESCGFVTGRLRMFKASSSTVCQWIPSFWFSPSENSILKSRNQENTTLEKSQNSR